MNQLNQGPNPNLHLRYSRFTEHLLTVQNLGLDKNAFKGKKKKKRQQRVSKPNSNKLFQTSTLKKVRRIYLHPKGRNNVYVSKTSSFPRFEDNILLLIQRLNRLSS